jgi:hypothetical protein
LSAEVISTYYCRSFCNIIHFSFSPTSRAALAALAITTTESALISELTQALGELSECNKVTLVWIPWHQRKPGNVEADRLAKEGAIGVFPGQTAVIDFVGKKRIKRFLELEHQAR